MPAVRRFISILAGTAAIVTACGGGAGTPADDAPAPASATSSPSGDAGTVEPSTTTEAPGTAPTTTEAPRGDPAPELTLELAAGGSFSLRGEQKPVYLVFWAEWCSTCSREIPLIDAIAFDYLDRVTFVAVAQNSSFEASARRAGDWFDPDRMLWGYSDEIGPDYGVRGQPVSFLITADDYVADQWFGPLPEAEIRARLDALVAGS